MRLLLRQRFDFVIAESEGGEALASSIKGDLRRFCCRARVETVVLCRDLLTPEIPFSPNRRARQALPPPRGTIVGLRLCQLASWRPGQNVARRGPITSIGRGSARERV